MSKQPDALRLAAELKAIQRRAGDVIDSDDSEAMHRAAAELRRLQAEVERLGADAGRYRWLRNESWAGYHQCKGRPEVAETVVLTRDGAGNVRTILAEEAMDAAIDAAIAASKDQG